MSDFPTDKVTIERKNGEHDGPFDASVQGREIFVFSVAADLQEGEFVLRELPTGRVERFEIMDSNFVSDGADSFFELKVRKATDPPPARPGPNINIGTAHGVQIGDYNTQTVVGALGALAAEIGAADVSDVEKDEAKSKLLAFLEHPLVQTIVGAAVGSIMTELRR